LKLEFAAFDPRNQGRIGEEQLLAMLNRLGIRITREKVRHFMEHIAALRPGSNATARPYISFVEFMNNRAAFMMLEVPVSKGKATLYTGSSHNTMGGLPPRRVSTATYSGDDSDKAISDALVARTKAFISCPGVAESSWKAFQHYEVEHPETKKNYGHPDRDDLHDPRDPLYQGRKQAPPGYVGFYPTYWYDEVGKRTRPGYRSPRDFAMVDAGKSKTKSKCKEGKPHDWLKIFPECLPTRTGFKENRRTTALASWPSMDYRRKSVRNARGKAFLGATNCSITLG